MSDLGIPSGPYFRPPERGRAHLAPLIVGGVIAAVVFALRSPAAAWIRGFLSRIPHPAEGGGMRLLDSGASPEALRGSILGRGKSAVAAFLGAPRTAAGAGAGKIIIGRQLNFWDADTWYYPLNSFSQTAIAVRFENGIARKIDFFDAPRAS